MKKLFFGMFIVAITLFIWTSCTQDVENEKLNSPETVEQELCKDLTILSNNLQSLYVDAMCSDATRSAAQYVQVNEQAIKEMEEHIKLFQQKYDICQDLDDNTKMKIAKMLSLSEDSLILLSLDDDIYLDYIHEIVSEDFYDIQCHFRRTGSFDLTEQEIINNHNLRLNEKLQLVILLPFVNYTQSLHKNTKMTRAAKSSTKTTSKERSRQQVLSEAESAKKECITNCMKNCAIQTFEVVFGTSGVEGFLNQITEYAKKMSPCFIAYGLLEAANDFNSCIYECEQEYQAAIK